MNPTWKIALACLAAILCLLGLGSWYVTSSINSAQLTGLLSSAVRGATGRDLKIAGPVSLTIFPAIGVRADNVSLSNASWATHAKMIELKHIVIGIRFLPLLSKRVEISRIDLNGLDAHLESNAKGESNWILAAPLAQGSTTNTSSKTPNNPVPSDDGDSLLSIENVSLTDARIFYQAGSGPQKVFEVKKLSLLGSGNQTAIQLDAQHANFNLQAKGKITAVRTIMNDWGTTPLKMNADLDLTLNGKALTVQGMIEKLPQKLPSFDLRISSQSFDLSPLVAGSALAATGGKLPNATSKAKWQSPYFFDDERLPFDMLPEANGKLQLAIAQLGLPSQIAIQNLNATVQFSGDQLDMKNVHFQLGNGQAQGNLSLSKIQSAAPILSINGSAKGFTVEQIIPDSKSKVSGGDTQLAFNLRSSGISLHQLASKANGQIQISVGQAKLASSFLNAGGDFVITVLDAINPLRKKSNQTILECAIAYLPIHHGLINVADSVGIETDRLNVVLAGSINLNNEAIHLSIYPREKSGITLGVNLANLIQLQGTLQNPSLGIDQAAVVKSAVSIGLGFLTGGASLLAENAQSMMSKSQPCKTALHPWADIEATVN